MDSGEERQHVRSQAIRYDFGSFQYDIVRRELSDAHGPVRIGNRALQLLEVLLESPGRLYSRDELVSRVWPRTVVEETSLRVHISALRRMLGDGQDGAKYILTVPGRGYAFVGEVQVLMPPNDAADATPGPAPLLPQRRLPARLTRPIGRGSDIARLGELLSRERLVSIVGAGGMGKTTVALAVAENQHAPRRQGPFFVDLSRLSDAALVVVEVGQSCGINVSRGEPWATIQDALRDQHALIILDNCEHVIDAAAAVAGRLLQTCPHVRILATSREPLEVEAEWVFRLPPLGMPGPQTHVALESARSYPAIQLFVERAEAACDSFQLTDVNVSFVQQLCSFLDGIPLAIELAAARVSSLGVQGLLQRLEDAFDLLTRGRRTAMSRHRTLHAVLNWSYQLLNETEKLALQRLAVFRDGFSLEAAVAVVACPQLDEARVLEALLSLCGKSLVTVEPGDGAVTLHRLLHVTRLFAERPLEASADAAAVHRRHAVFVLDRMVAGNNAQVDSLNGNGSVDFASTTAELRSAITWALLDENDLPLGMELTAQSRRIFYSASLIDEYRRYVIAAIDKTARAGVEGSRLEFELQKPLTFISSQTLTGHQGRDQASRKTRELGARFGSTAERIEALYAICVDAYGHGDYLEALSCCEEIRELAQGELADLSVALADRLSALSLHALGQHDAAERLAHRVMQFNRTLQARFQSHVPFAVSMRIQLARIHWLRGDFQLAWTTLHTAISLNGSANIFARCQPLGIAAIPIAIWKGDLDSASRWSRELLEHSTRTSHSYWQAFAKVYCAVLERQAIAPGSAEARLLKQSPKLMDIVATLWPGTPDAVTLDRVREGKVGWCAPEVIRLDALARLDPHQEESRTRCIHALRLAFDLSVEQGARFWSLRIAKSVHRISLDASAERGWARKQMLALLNAIDDGSMQPDLQEARLLCSATGPAGLAEAVPSGEPAD